MEDSWATGLLAGDLGRFSGECRARFSNAFLAFMALRIAMLSRRLLHASQAEKIGMA